VSITVRPSRSRCSDAHHIVLNLEQTPALASNRQCTDGAAVLHSPSKTMAVFEGTAAMVSGCALSFCYTGPLPALGGRFLCDKSNDGSSMLREDGEEFATVPETLRMTYDSAETDRDIAGELERCRNFLSDAQGSWAHETDATFAQVDRPAAVPLARRLDRNPRFDLAALELAGDGPVLSRV
jgi:hypothetical protein